MSAETVRLLVLMAFLAWLFWPRPPGDQGSYYASYDTEGV